MSNINVAAAEKVALVGTIDPATIANTEVFTDVVDMHRWHQCLGIALLGNMASETVDFKAYRCDSRTTTRRSSSTSAAKTSQPPLMARATSSSAS